MSRGGLASARKVGVLLGNDSTEVTGIDQLKSVAGGSVNDENQGWQSYGVRV